MSLSPLPGSGAILYGFTGGGAFFAGLALAAFGLVLRFKALGRGYRLTALILAVLGAAAVLFSATPIPWTVHGLWLGLLAAAWAQVDCPGRTSKCLAGAALAACVALAGWEAPHHIAPKIDAQNYERLYVIGDSLAMGASAPAENWPERLGAALEMETRNFSFGGATAATSVSNARRIEGDQGLVLVAVGGNDVLGGNFRTFEEDLRELLEAAGIEDRQVVMLELPLPPLHNAFGQAQRRLARQYGVALIPKRVLARVLFTPGATVDGLHLSDEGHRLLAATLEGLLRPGSSVDKP